MEARSKIQLQFLQFWSKYNKKMQQILRNFTFFFLFGQNFWKRLEKSWKFFRQPPQKNRNCIFNAKRCKFNFLNFWEKQKKAKKAKKCMLHTPFQDKKKKSVFSFDKYVFKLNWISGKFQNQKHECWPGQLCIMTCPLKHNASWATASGGPSRKRNLKLPMLTWSQGWWDGVNSGRAGQQDLNKSVN